MHLLYCGRRWCFLKILDCEMFYVVHTTSVFDQHVVELKGVEPSTSTMRM